MALQDEIRRTEESRDDHRLHGVLLVAHGMNCPEVARLLGDAPRTVESWLRRFETQGLGGLTEGARSGRPRRLPAAHMANIERVLRQPPREAGRRGHVWDGQTLAAGIDKTFEIDRGVRQCQRLFRPLGFRLRKPRPMIATADPERQKAHTTTPESAGHPRRRPVGDRCSPFPAAWLAMPDVGSARK